jgi:hypothetical protein
VRRAGFVAAAAGALDVGAVGVTVCTGVRVVVVVVVAAGVTTRFGAGLDDFTGAGSGLGPLDDPLEGAASGPDGD